MKNTTITTVNTKGQLVIPKDIRNALGITPDVSLKVTLRGQGITIYPIDELVTRGDEENTLFKILEVTHGAWGPETQNEKRKEKARRRKELTASKRRKASW